MGRLLILGGTVLSIVNIALFWFWWSLVKVEATTPDQESVYMLNALSVQISLLQTVLAAVGIALAFIGFLGYQTIKEAAVEKAVSESQKEVQIFLNKSGSEIGPAGQAGLTAQAREESGQAVNEEEEEEAAER